MKASFFNSKFKIAVLYRNFCQQYSKQRLGFAAVYSKKNIDAKEDEISINLESQASGLYLVCVERNGKTQKAKFIKR